MNFYYCEEGKYCTLEIVSTQKFYLASSTCCEYFLAPPVMEKKHFLIRETKCSSWVLFRHLTYFNYFNRLLFKNANEEDYSTVRNVSMSKNVFKNKQKNNNNAHRCCVTAAATALLYGKSFMLTGVFVVVGFHDEWCQDC